MRISISREHGLIGLYWCRATKELVFNLTSRFGIKLRFAQTEAEKEAEIKALCSMIDEKRRLETLSNRQLVTEVLNTDAAEYEEVLEMMGRLDPHWLDDPDPVPTKP